MGIGDSRLRGKRSAFDEVNDALRQPISVISAICGSKKSICPIRSYSKMLHIANYSLYLPRIQLTLLMRHISNLSFIFFFSFLVSCSTDVDLFADYKEVPVVYGLLDADADTNFILIKRAFLSEDNPMQYISVPDSTSYPGRLDVRLVEYDNGEKLREIILDTITKYNKEPGAFPNPKQKMYYTVEPLQRNTASHEYSYQLLAVIKGETLKVKTKMVGGDGFEIWSRSANFSVIPDNTYPKKLFFYPAQNGALYQLGISFTFREQRGEGNDSVPRTMYWDLGMNRIEDLWLNSDGLYQVNYAWGTFYMNLREFLGADTVAPGVKRFIGDWPITFYICAGGREMEDYLVINGVTGGEVQTQLDYSPIEGGVGLFSSRCYRTQRARLAGTTVPELIDLNWGFKFSGGDW